ncbi:hypothetical protein Tco_0063971, partial [Tanacetum coccineum]
GEESVFLTKEYIRKVVDDVGKDEDFKGRSWVSAVEFVNADGGGLFSIRIQFLVMVVVQDRYKLDEEALNLALEKEAKATRAEHEWLEKCRQEQDLTLESQTANAKWHGQLNGNAPLGAEVKAACALEVEAMDVLDLMEVEAVGALDLVEVMGALDLVKVEAICLVGSMDLVGFSLNIFFSALVSGNH